MENLKTLLDQQSIQDIQQQLGDFIHSADGHENKLKLVFALLNLIRESANLLTTIDSEDFIKEISNQIGEIQEQAGNLKDAYHDHLAQDNIIFSLLGDGTNNNVKLIQENIDNLLKEYDEIIQALVAAREKLPIEGQLNEKNT